MSTMTTKRALFAISGSSFTVDNGADDLVLTSNQVSESAGPVVSEVHVSVTVVVVVVTSALSGVMCVNVDGN